MTETMMSHASRERGGGIIGFSSTSVNAKAHVTHWTPADKFCFVGAVRSNGRDWAAVAEAVDTHDSAEVASFADQLHEAAGVQFFNAVEAFYTSRRGGQPEKEVLARVYERVITGQLEQDMAKVIAELDGVLCGLGSSAPSRKQKANADAPPSARAARRRTRARVPPAVAVAIKTEVGEGEETAVPRSKRGRPKQTVPVADGLVAASADDTEQEQPQRKRRRTKKQQEQEGQQSQQPQAPRRPRPAQSKQQQQQRKEAQVDQQQQQQQRCADINPVAARSIKQEGVRTTATPRKSSSSAKNPSRARKAKATPQTARTEVVSSVEQQDGQAQLCEMSGEEVEQHVRVTTPASDGDDTARQLLELADMTLQTPSQTPSCASSRLASASPLRISVPQVAQAQTTVSQGPARAAMQELESQASNFDIHQQQPQMQPKQQQEHNVQQLHEQQRTPPSSCWSASGPQQQHQQSSLLAKTQSHKEQQQQQQMQQALELHPPQQQEKPLTPRPPSTQSVADFTFRGTASFQQFHAPPPQPLRLFKPRQASSQANSKPLPPSTKPAATLLADALPPPPHVNSFTPQASPAPSSPASAALMPKAPAPHFKSKAPTPALLKQPSNTQLNVNEQATLQPVTEPQVKPSAHKSEYTGVQLRQDGWWSKLKTGEKTIMQGPFKTEIEAAKGYDRIAREHRGPRTRCNFDQNGNFKPRAKPKPKTTVTAATQPSPWSVPSPSAATTTLTTAGVNNPTVGGLTTATSSASPAQCLQSSQGYADADHQGASDDDDDWLPYNATPSVAQNALETAASVGGCAAMSQSMGYEDDGEWGECGEGASYMYQGAPWM